MCDAPFKMERGCLLEKRCPACRILKVSVREDEPFYKKRHRVFVSRDGSKFKAHCFYPQEPTLKLLFDDINIKELSDDIMDQIIEEDGYSHINRLLLENLKPREIEILTMHLNEYTMLEISREFNITRERVRQVIEHIMKQLRHPILGKQLKKYT